MTICAGTTGPAVGSRGLIGHSQEGCWGKQQPTPRKYWDMLNESIVSDFGSLISASLRPDRAVHKRIGGVEAAGGDVAVELGPTGYGTLLKHSLGQVLSSRVDDAFVLKVTNGSVTSAVLDITHAAGEATTFDVTLAGGGSTSFSADLTDATADAIGELMVLINNHADLAAYSPYSYYGGGTDTTLQSEDYSADADPTSTLEEHDQIDLMAHTDMAWVVCRDWGIYSHQINAHSEVPEGLSILVGRDVAAFLYAGSRVNTLNIAATPQEILTATFGIMAKGGTTASEVTADSGNTGHEKDAFSIRYKGTGATCTMTIVHGDTFQIDSATAAEDIMLNIAEEYVDPDTGRVYAVNKLGGLLEYLVEVAGNYLDVSIADFADWEMPSTYLKVATGVSIKTANRVMYPFDSTDLTADPAVWGDYIGTDSGTPVVFYVRVATGGVPGTATIEFSTDGSTYYNETTTSATEPTEVRTGAGNVNTGFTIFFPDAAALQANDVWTFQTIYVPPTSPTYASDQDPFSGFEGALTMDNVVQDVMGWNTTLTNNLFGDKYHMGERVRGMLPEQQRTIEGTLTVEFDDLDLYRRFVNGEAASLQIAFTTVGKITHSVHGDSKQEYSLTVLQPNIEFNGATPVIGGPEIITTDMPYVAMWDDANSIPDMRITLVNDVPYL